ncbi:hypothetical protein [Cellulomonas fimi]|uniref:Uncharacterized protein n=1 Tax=Cellulomonas fimi TaxID=1708 RepID=A0A7Y0LWG4_CELFI|nr:hypothetical protein [Cellulomonas fimi]NMR19179.1 hypothetical protein [Cellulomonas fimi]
MNANWRDPVSALVDGMDGWDGAWTLVYAAGQVALNPAESPTPDQGLGLVYAALDLSHALTEIESIAYHRSASVAVDLGDVSMIDAGAVVAAVDELVVAAERAVMRALAQPDADISQTLLGARVLTLLSAARAELDGSAR